MQKIWRLGQVRNANLARMSLMKCSQMLQNPKAAPFTVFELLRKSQQKVKLPPHFINFLLNFHYKGILQGEMWNWIVKRFFSGYSIVYTTFSPHQRSLEAGSGTWILQKLKQRCQYFNWKSYQPWSNTPYKK